MFLKGVFKSQWSSLWNQQPLEDREGSANEAAHGIATIEAEDAGVTVVPSSPEMSTESPLRKRPRTCANAATQHGYDLHAHTSQEGLHNAPEQPRDTTPITARASIYHRQHEEAASHRTANTSETSALDVLGRHRTPRASSTERSGPLWRAPHCPVGIDAPRGTLAAVPRLVPRSPPQAVDVCHILSHIWFRMMRDQQRASPAYIVTDEACWLSSVQAAAKRYPVENGNTCGSLAATLVRGVDPLARPFRAGAPGANIRHAADVASSDDDDRWVPVLRQLSQQTQPPPAERTSHVAQHHRAAPPPPFANSTTVRSGCFDTSIDAVRSLMLLMIEAESYIDPSIWLVALIYAERMHRRHASQWQHTTCPHHQHNESDDTPATFVFYRRHELRILFSLFTLAVKQLSDLYVQVRNLHRVLPSFITSYTPAPKPQQTWNAAALPLSLRQKFPHIAQRLEDSLMSEATMLRRQHGEHDAPLSAPYTLDCAGRMEVAILRDGLGYHTLVRENDLAQLLVRFASPNEASTLTRYMEHRIHPRSS
jgi:hypothetical protein